MGSASEDAGSSAPRVRKVRVHKIRRDVNSADEVALSKGEKQERDAALDRRIAELIPGLADLSVSAPPGASAIASEVRQKLLSREDAHKAELLELRSIYDMAKPNAVESALPAGGMDEWEQTMRPRVRKVQLSPYQYEMINYQRMLMRKNTWYYRDRMSVPRGPCPLHVLKDAWVQGVIDENTLMWGQGLADWLPAKNVKLLLPMVRTPEVQLGAWMKRTFSLKPALNRIRETRKDVRVAGNLSMQVEAMR
ncbi:hypothetical protein FOA52_012434 [Chlamydomonas sp. UWO 241]|nr:hypothetical protein FOA52_012434 [Chlamydomonas sp. UWO 241]